MMPTDTVLQQLQSAVDDPSRLRAIRYMKNQLIGNRHKKVQYLEQGAVPLVLSATASADGADVLAQGAAALASITYQHRAAAHDIQASNGVETLVKLLGHDNLTVVEHAARALNSICQELSDGAAGAPIGIDAFPRIAALILQLHHPIATAAVKLAHNLLMYPDAVQGFDDTDLMANLSQKLRSVDVGAAPWEPSTLPLRTCVVVTMLRVLAAMPKYAKCAAQCLPQLVQAARNGPCELQRAACGILVELTSATNADCTREAAAGMSTLQLPLPLGRGCDAASRAAADAEAAGTEASPSQIGTDDVVVQLRSVVVPPLVHQLHLGSGDVPCMLYATISQDDALARAVADTNALEQLAAIIIKEAGQLPDAEDAMVEDDVGAKAKHSASGLCSAFQCIELLCSCSSPDTPGATNATAVLWEKHRAAVCTSAAVAAMCKCLAHAEGHVRLAVAKSLRVLARSQDAFAHETLADGQLAAALAAALHDDEAISIEVCLAISNFVTTPSSPARQQFFDKGIVQKVLALVTMKDNDASPALRTAAMAAVRNAANAAPHPIRQGILADLSWPCIRTCLQGTNDQLALNTWSMLQNLCHALNGESFATQVLQATEQELLPQALNTIRGHLEGLNGEDGAGKAVGAKLTASALWLLNNIATASDDQKAALMEAGVPSVLPGCLEADHGKPADTQEIRLATCWIVRNLVYPTQASEQPSGREHEAEAASAQRASALQDAGVATALTQLMITPLDSELAQRASRALEALHGKLVESDASAPTAVLPADAAAAQPSSSARDTSWRRTTVVREQRSAAANGRGASGSDQALDGFRIYPGLAREGEGAAPATAPVVDEPMATDDDVVDEDGS